MLLTRAVCLAARSMPASWCHWRLTRWAIQLARRNAVQLPEKLLRTRHGFTMKLDLEDWLGQHLYATGEYEPATTRLIEACLAPGDVFVDAGANAGYFSLLAARIVGRAGRVLSFEPVPQIYRRLQENIGLNGYRHCQAFDAALSNADGDSEFFVGPKNHVGTSSLRALDKASRRIGVHTVRLDEILEANGRVDCIKIDVEGAECHVLEGMTGVLNRCRPDLIIEITPEYLKPLHRSTGDIQRILEPHGYRAFAIEDQGLRPLSHLDSYGMPQFNAYFTATASRLSNICVLNEQR